MGAIVIRTRYDEGTESAEVATSGEKKYNIRIKPEMCKRSFLSVTYFSS